MTALLVVSIWLAVSVPASLLLGAVLGHRATERPPAARAGLHPPHLNDPTGNLLFIGIPGLRPEPVG